ncbi:MAG: c-type cytochrome [Phenylobacterium sp.]|uniref:c-type cytochrome n=1 Tax=Phenylobacterium sp. TaxID=1871053 RepID=UPI00391BF3C1
MPPSQTKTSAAAIAVVLAVTAGGVALAQTAAQNAVAARQAGFKTMGAAFKAVNDELKKGQPDMKVVAAQSRTVNVQAHALPGWFAKGSGAESGAKTKAKAEIWTDSDTFAAAARALQTETAKLQSLAAGGDAGAVRDQVRAVGAACGNCHKPFRAD